MTNTQKKELRKKIELNLKKWMPHNDEIVQKELNIFDRLMNRRDFLKTTSFAAIAAMLNHGCSDHKLPSQIQEDDDGTITLNDMASVSTPANIMVDSDILTTSMNYNPLPALNSSDASDVKYETTLESFNPHIMTINSLAEVSQNTLKKPDRTYGTPEYVQLVQAQADDDYQLQLYEHGINEQHGHVETILRLENTSKHSYNKLIATNGNFHNQTSGSKAYNQKFVLLAELGVNFNISIKSSLKLFYQLGSTSILLPGIEPNDSFQWKEIDLLKVFIQNNTHSFDSYRITEIDTYNDGNHNSFIFGTINFDSYYNYGFIVTCNQIDQNEPTIVFFAPEFLSVQSNTISALKHDFENANLTSTFQLSDFAIFKNQIFRPLAQILDPQGIATSKVIFSFVCYDTSASPTQSTEEAVGGSYLFNTFVKNNVTDVYTKSFFKRYLMSVDTASNSVQYGFGGYKPTASIQADDSAFKMDFDTASLPSVDVWKEIYDRNTYELNNSFTRSLLNNSEELEIITAAPYYDQVNIGVVHKSVKLSFNSDAFTDISVLKSNAYFDDSTYEDNTYKELWFDDMKEHLNGCNSLTECTLNNNNIIEFYCAQNHQGLLRSYFIFRAINDDDSVNSFLVSFNEQGIIPETTEQENSFSYQNHSNLQNQIANESTPHYPPMPVAIDPYIMHPWYSISSDGEVIYTAARSFTVNPTTKKLVENDGSSNLKGYVYASCNIVDKSWSMFEAEKEVNTNNIALHQISKETHQVHLHVTNIYGMNAKLDDASYVEVRFSKDLIVKDHTKDNALKTYKLDQFTSIFLKPDSLGRITLEIDIGTQDDKYSGAIMEYRFVNKNALSQQNNLALCTLNTTDGVTEYKECNISFRMYERLSSDNYDQKGYGMKDITTVKHTLENSVHSDAQNSVSLFADGFKSLHTKSTPQNESPTRSLSDSYVQNGTGIVLINNGNNPSSEQQQPSFLFRSHHHNHHHFNPMHFIRHAAHTIKHKIVKAAHTIAKAAKKAASKLVPEISEIIKNIDNNIENAAHDLAASVEKAWDSVKSFAQQLWNWLIALFDMDAIWQIAQELKQLYIDQFKPLSDSSSQNTASRNAYSVLESEQQTILDNIQSVTKQAKEGIDSSIDSAFGNSKTFDSNAKDGRNRHAKAKSHSAKNNHLLDQLKRILSSLSPSLPDGCAIDASSGPEKLLKDTFQEISDTTTDGLKQTASETMASVKNLASGISLQESGLQLPLKTLSDTILDDMSSVFEGMVQFPTALLDGSTTLQCLENETHSEVEKAVLELFGLMLFSDANKFTSMKDLIYFMFGFSLNIVDEVVGGAISLSGEKVDIRSFIQNGTFRTTINNIGTSNRSLLQDTQSEKNWQTVLLVCDTIETVLVAAQTALILVNANSTSKTLQKLIIYAELVRALLRTPDLLYFMVQNPSILGLFKEFSFIASRLSRMGQLITKNSSIDIDLVYMWIYVILQLIATILEVIYQTTISKAKYDLKMLESIESTSKLLIALMGCYIEPVTRAGEKEDIPVLENESLVIAYGADAIFYVIKFSLSIAAFFASLKED